MACLQIPPVLCNTVVFLLLIVCSLLSISHAKSCKPSDSANLDLRDPSLAWKTVTYDRVNQGHLFLTDSGTLLFDTRISTPLQDVRTVSSYKNTRYSKLSGLYLPWGYIWYGGTFRLSFNMSVDYEQYNEMPSSSLVVAILPAYDFDNSPPPNKPMFIQIQPDSLSQITYGFQMGSCKWPVYGVSTGCVNITIDPKRNSVESFIVYDPLGKRLSVSLGEAARNPEAPYAVASSMVLDLSEVLAGNQIGQIGLFSSIGQLAQLQTWNLTVDRPLPKEGSQRWAIILSSVLGSVAATTVVAAAVYCYLNSKYRRWKKDLDQLVKTMQSLPGVPTQVDLADIKKATNNFHETMKLGRGGFGAVYGCTLPAAASRTGQAAMRVAVKKFTRELTDRRYEDFLAEVSIINRLRHKNVVPLVGWSYNKGEPLLIYEYMKNGSLDQHLFQSGCFGQQQQGIRQQRQDTTATGQWVTRYSIARDIAMGLQYLHHEHEPMVLHRDIKASNIMLDSNLCARLGDFGIACTVDAERSSVTGVAGTIGYMGPEYVVNCKATRQTDIFAFGVVILEIVTGKKNTSVPADDGHITQWVRRLRREGALLQALDDKLTIPNSGDFVEEAQRLLLLGLACTNPNPSSRPSMTEVLEVINKLAPPPDVSLHDQPSPLGWIWSSISSSEPAANQEGSSDSSNIKLGHPINKGKISSMTSKDPVFTNIPLKDLSTLHQH